MTIWNYTLIPPKTGAGVAEIPNGVTVNRIIGKDSGGQPVSFEAWIFEEHDNFILKADGNDNQPPAHPIDCSWCNATTPQIAPNQPIAQSGNVGISFVSDGWIALAGLGSYPGTQSYQFWVDKQKVADVLTDASVPAPSISTTYNWDTTQYCNGAHEVFPVSFTPSGQPSMAEYMGQPDITPGAYRPIIIYTNNPTRFYHWH